MHTDSASKSTPHLPDTLPIASASFRFGERADAEGFGFASEWVLPDRLGGFAMGSISGVPMRRYHGLLCASLSPPVCRCMMLSALDESLHISAGGVCGSDLDVHLTGFQFANHDQPPIQNPYLSGFSKSGDTCRWTFTIPTQLGTVHIRKALTIADGVGGCRIEYEIESGLEHDGEIALEIRPLVAMRDFHGLNQPGSMSLDGFAFKPILEPAVGGVAMTREGLDAALMIRGVRIDWERSPAIWRNLRYHHETMRGQDDTEDLVCPGVFATSIIGGTTRTLSIEATIGIESTIDWDRCALTKRRRVRSSIDHALAAAGNPDDPELRSAIATLAQAGDDFVVSRMIGDERSTSVIAGYPWFADWGRDAMISLPGLMLTSGRFEQARETLRTFADTLDHGLIPNRFDDNDAPSHYNTVDASLWFVHACDQWAQASGHQLDPGLIDACDEIIDAYIQGTINRIGLDESDGLIRAGDANSQLTWMDALRDGVVFTPRFGKPIEINALWINAIESRMRMNDRRNDLGSYAKRARESIIDKMTQGPGGGLVDRLYRTHGVRTSHTTRSDELRPNQIFAVSLPLVGLPEKIGRASFKATTDSLLTPVGLRTLSPDDTNYCPHYTGSMSNRDLAYHNGTVWPWLLGPYCEAKLRLNHFDDTSRKNARAIMLGLVSRMDSDSVAQLFEIYDAEPDENGHRQPRGCIAQAWSIAEALRVLVLSCQS